MDLMVCEQLQICYKSRYLGPRTTNAAEGYHSRQRHFYRRKNLPLGEWIVNYRKVAAEEEDHATAIKLGLQLPDVREKTKEVFYNFQSEIECLYIGK